jgi:TfoX/Sxy family transcriptional regulator of competence genes
MSTDQKFAEFIVDQIENAGTIRVRKMFGEYALYSNEKVVGLICDNQLFIKVTSEGRLFAGDLTESSPYPGGKPALLIDDRLEDREWLSELIRITERVLPSSTKRKKKAR